MATLNLFESNYFDKVSNEQDHPLESFNPSSEFTHLSIKESLKDSIEESTGEKDIIQRLNTQGEVLDMVEVGIDNLFNYEDNSTEDFTNCEGRQFQVYDSDFFEESNGFEGVGQQADESEEIANYLKSEKEQKYEDMDAEASDEGMDATTLEFAEKNPDGSENPIRSIFEKDGQINFNDENSQFSSQSDTDVSSELQAALAGCQTPEAEPKLTRNRQTVPNEPTKSSDSTAPTPNPQNHASPKPKQYLAHLISDFEELIEESSLSFHNIQISQKAIETINIDGNVKPPLSTKSTKVNRLKPKVLYRGEMHNRKLVIERIVEINPSDFEKMVRDQDKNSEKVKELLERVNYKGHTLRRKGYIGNKYKFVQILKSTGIPKKIFKEGLKRFCYKDPAYFRTKDNKIQDRNCNLLYTKQGLEMGLLKAKSGLLEQKIFLVIYLDIHYQLKVYNEIYFRASGRNNLPPSVKTTQLYFERAVKTFFRTEKGKFDQQAVEQLLSGEMPLEEAKHKIKEKVQRIYLKLSAKSHDLGTIDCESGMDKSEEVDMEGLCMDVSDDEEATARHKSAKTSVKKIKQIRKTSEFLGKRPLEVVIDEDYHCEKKLKDEDETTMGFSSKINDYMSFEKNGNDDLENTFGFHPNNCKF